MVVLTFAEDGKAHPLMQVCFGVFALIGLALTLKSTVFKVDVENTTVKVKAMFGRRYTFDYKDIISVAVIIRGLICVIKNGWRLR